MMNFTNQERKYIQREIERMRTGWYQKYEINDGEGLLLTRTSKMWERRSTSVIYSPSSPYSPNVYLYNWVMQNMVHKFL